MTSPARGEFELDRAGTWCLFSRAMVSGSSGFEYPQCYSGRDSSKRRMKEVGNLEIPVIEIFKTNSEAILFQLEAVLGSEVKIPVSASIASSTTIPVSDRSEPGESLSCFVVTSSSVRTSDLVDLLGFIASPTVR